MNEFFDSEKNNKIPLITVAMPVYNGEEYLEDSINSILAQTFSNFELIILDDGSTDGTLDILIAFKLQDPRIKIISRENRGLSNSINEILEIAQGEWIARMDHDDLAMPDRFEKQLKWLELTGADICGSWIRLFGTSDNRVLKHSISDYGIKIELLFCCAFAHPTVIMRASKIKALRYDSNWDKAEDYDLWVRASYIGLKMTNIPEVLLLYRQHDLQVSTLTYEIQQSLTVKIRKRYWNYISKSINININEKSVIFKLFDSGLLKDDVFLIQSVFTKILETVNKESRSIIFCNITKIYYKIAFVNFYVPFYWLALNRKFGTAFGFKNFLYLLFFAVFKIKLESVRFKRFKIFYF